MVRAALAISSGSHTTNDQWQSSKGKPSRFYASDHFEAVFCSFALEEPLCVADSESESDKSGDPMHWWGLEFGWQSRFRIPTSPVEGLSEVVYHEGISN